MADAEIIQLGSRGPAGRGSRTAPSAAARGLAGDTSAPRARRRTAPAPKPALEDDAPESVFPTDPPTEETFASAGGTAPGPGLNALLTELPGLLTDLLRRTGAAGRAFSRRLSEDPVRLATSLADALGVDSGAVAAEVAAFVRSRVAADYTVDEFGFDVELTEKVFLPLLRPLVRSWFRVELRGAENLPATGPALLVSNHAGTMPLDGMVLHAVVFDEIGRHARMLGADLIFATPFSHDLARKTGTTLACQEDAERLLRGGELVSVFPEGFKGLGKRYADRYKLQRFGRGGFVSAAVRASVPIIPVSIVGSEEIYPLISRAPALARALGWPYFPITPLFPWFGPLGAIPLPSRWIIQVGEAIATDELPAGAAEDPMVVFNVTDQVRETIQHTLYALLMQRERAFF